VKCYLPVLHWPSSPSTAGRIWVNQLAITSPTPLPLHQPILVMSPSCPLIHHTFNHHPMDTFNLPFQHPPTNIPNPHTGCRKDYFFQKNPRNIVMVFQNILSSFLRKNCKKNKTYFINILVQIIVKEYYIFIGEI
jgi:hypothetical protein